MSIASIFDLRPQGGFGAILADPPWTFENYSEEGEDRNPNQHYACMTLEDICALPVEALAARDCALFLWACDPLLPQALDVIRAWGFTYKTIGFDWAKLNKGVRGEKFGISDFFLGTGYWARANVERCLLATRGSPARLDAGVRRLLISPLREHSRKPFETHLRIQRLVGGPYLELFGRAGRPGWTVVGNEADKFGVEGVGRPGALPGPAVTVRMNFPASPKAARAESPQAAHRQAEASKGAEAAPKAKANHGANGGGRPADLFALRDNPSRGAPTGRIQPTEEAR